MAAFPSFKNENRSCRFWDIALGIFAAAFEKRSLPPYTRVRWRGMVRCGAFATEARKSIVVETSFAGALVRECTDRVRWTSLRARRCCKVVAWLYLDLGISRTVEAMSKQKTLLLKTLEMTLSMDFERLIVRVCMYSRKNIVLYIIAGYTTGPISGERVWLSFARWLCTGRFKSDQISTKKKRLQDGDLQSPLSISSSLILFFVILPFFSQNKKKLSLECATASPLSVAAEVTSNKINLFVDSFRPGPLIRKPSFRQALQYM